MPSGAGALDKRIDFLEPVFETDGHGGGVTRWERRFRVWARLQPKLGSEEVVASRLQGKQPYIVRVRSSSETRGVGTDWRICNALTGARYSIKSVANVDERNAYLDFMAVEGDDD